MKKNYYTKLKRIGIILRKIIWYLECKEVFKNYTQYDTVYNIFHITVKKENQTYFVNLRFTYPNSREIIKYEFCLVGSEVTEISSKRLGIIELRDLYSELIKK